MKRPIAFVTAAWFLAMSSVGLSAGPQQPVGQSHLNINHDPVKCVSATRRPVVDADVIPQNEIERGSLFFKENGTKDFYYVVMKARPLNIAGELPRPLAGMNGMEYYVEVTNVARVPTKTSHFRADFDSACSDRRSSTSSDCLTVGLTREGQNPVPPGFNKDDICKVILLSGATVSLPEATAAFSAGAGAAGAGAAGAAGLSTGVLVAGGVVLAVTGGLVIANNTGGGGGGSVSPSRPTRSN